MEISHAMLPQEIVVEDVGKDGTDPNAIKVRKFTFIINFSIRYFLSFQFQLLFLVTCKTVICQSARAVENTDFAEG